MSVEKNTDLELINEKCASSVEHMVPLFINHASQKVENVLEDKSTEIAEAYENLDFVADKVRSILGNPIQGFADDMAIELAASKPDYIAINKRAMSLQQIILDVNKSIREELVNRDFGKVALGNQEALIRYDLRREKVSDFCKALGHDLAGTPFNSILGFSEILGERDMGEVHEDMMLKRILVFCSQGLPEMLKNILMLADDPIYQEMEGVDVLGGERDEMISRAQEKDIDLSFDIDPNLNIFTAGDRLDTVLRNFVNNSLKFTPSGTGVISVSAKEEGEEIVFNIMDNGTGIPESTYLSFQDLFDIEKTNDINDFSIRSAKGTKEEPGTGNGMKLARLKSDEILGKIDVQSEEGEGTTFTLRIPKGKDFLVEFEAMREEMKEREVRARVAVKELEMQGGSHVMFPNGVVVFRERNWETYKAIYPLFEEFTIKGESLEYGELPEGLVDAVETCSGIENPETIPDGLPGEIEKLKAEVAKYLATLN